MARNKVKINKNYFLMKRILFLAVLSIIIGLNSFTTGQNNNAQKQEKLSWYSTKCIFTGKFYPEIINSLSTNQIDQNE